METPKQKYTVIISVVIVLALASIVWYWNNRILPVDGQHASVAATTTGLDIIGVTATSGPVKKDGYTIEMIPAGTNIPKAPSIDRPLPETLSLSAEARTALLTNHSKTIANLRSNPKSYGDWLDLGALRQTLGDYIGAVEAWNYAVVLAPNTAVAYANLGYLYAHDIKDYPKAEINYLKGIANDPRSVNTYRNLVDLYTYSYKQTTTAVEDTLKKAITANPKAVELQVILARYYKAKGRTAEAQTTYDSAIANATAQGQTSLATELTAEKSTN